MSNTSAVRALLEADMVRAWGWLEHWGHEPFRADLGGLDIITLIDMKTEVQARVKVLAENWELWYP
jgi:hypothetical protein